MRIAIVSPYSWSYPGGVTRHIEGLRGELSVRGHDLRVFAPFDPPDRLSRVLHRTEPQVTALPEWVEPLGRTMGMSANGSITNLSVFPEGVSALRRGLDDFAPDVVHLHEPTACVVAWDACSYRGAPVVGTFHAYSTSAWPNHVASLCGARRKFNQLQARIAVSEAARWTGRRWFGGEYVVIPNGVDLDGPELGVKRTPGDFRVLFVGRAEERKGIPVLLAAFEELVERVPAQLEIVGASEAEVLAHPVSAEARERIRVKGRVDHDELWKRLGEADVLCAPSLRGESFGMILTEAFAAATPVVASAIAGYSAVVTDGVDGVLVPPGDPHRLAEELAALHGCPGRREAMGNEARRSAERFGWPSVAARVESVLEEATHAPVPDRTPAGVRRRLGLVPIDGSPPVRATRLAPLEGEAGASSNPGSARRRAGFAAAATGAGVLGWLGVSSIGFGDVAEAMVRSDLAWVLGATALMMASLFLRAASWLAIARAALPRSPLRARDVTSATMIGVFMSATLPARLGEPARAMVLARRVGRVRETLPVLLGTLVSQTMLNLVALAALGAIIIGSTDLFSARTEELFLVSFVPVALLFGVLAGPALVRVQGSGRLAQLAAGLQRALVRVRAGLAVFRNPRKGTLAAAAQLGAWGLQLMSCLVLFSALGLDERLGIGAAAAVLFAVNVTAVVPATPSNVGVFQLAVISVLSTGFGVGAADALAYGVILQAVEIATAVVLGLPALLREGFTWSDMRAQAMAGASVPQASDIGRSLS